MTREEGNEALGRGEYGNAIEIYTKALVNANVDEKAKLYSNRSLAYYRLENWEASLDDACNTIEVSPEWDKGYIRKALSLIKLKRSPRDTYLEGFQKCPDSKVLSQVCKNIQVPGSNEAIVKEKDNDTVQPRISWHEKSLEQQALERGVLYGKMKIDHPDTPFLVYDKHLAENHNLIGAIQNRNAEPEYFDITELQAKLGILEVHQDKGEEIKPTVANTSEEIFKEKRKEVYRDEGLAFAKSVAEQTPTE